MAEWKEYKLSEIGEVVGGATPSTKEPSNYDGNISWITPKDLSNFSDRYISRGERMITQKGYKSCSCRLLPQGSILFSSRAPIGYVAIAAKELCTNQGFKSLIPNEKIVNNIFAYYLLLHNKSRIEGLGSGTTFKEVSGKVMKDVSVLIPSLETQRQIASILSSLDNKIENNRKINANLEAQAQALFKSWFVDFEPFKDGEFQDSELGRIPKGWRVERIEDLSQKMASGGTPKSLNKDYYSGDIRWFSTKELKDCFLFESEKHISDEALNNSAAKMFPAGTVLMAIYAAPTVGRLGLLTAPSTFNQAAVGIVPKEEIGSEFIYLSLLSERINLNNLASGAAQQNLNVGIVKNYQIIVPNQNILNKFNKIAKGIFESIKTNTDESRRLASLRDALLPRLMSGELKVNDVIRNF